MNVEVLLREFCEYMNCPILFEMDSDINFDNEDCRVYGCGYKRSDFLNFLRDTGRCIVGVEGKLDDVDQLRLPPNPSRLVNYIQREGYDIVEE